MSTSRTTSTGKRVEWDFFSFPPLYTFCGGMLLASLLLPFLGYIFFVIALFGFSFCTAHFIAHGLRKRMLDRKVQMEEEEERERRALAARAAAARGTEATTTQRRTRRRRR